MGSGQGFRRATGRRAGRSRHILNDHAPAARGSRRWVLACRTHASGRDRRAGALTEGGGGGERGGQPGAGRGERERSWRGRGPAPCAAPAPCARPPPAAAAASLPDLCSSSEKGENVCVWRGGGRALSSRGAPGNRAGWASGGGGGGGGERAAAGCPVCARAEWARAGRVRPEPCQAAAAAAAARSGRAGRAEPSRRSLAAGPPRWMSSGRWAHSLGQRRRRCLEGRALFEKAACERGRARRPFLARPRLPAPGPARPRPAWAAGPAAFFTAAPLSSSLTRARAAGLRGRRCLGGARAEGVCARV